MQNILKVILKKKIKKIIANKYFFKKIKNIKNFYGDGKSTLRIFKKLMSISLNKKLRYKKTTF